MVLRAYAMPSTYAVRDEVDSEQVQAAAVGRTGTCSSSKLTRSTPT